MSEGYKHRSILSVNRGIPKSKEKAAVLSAVSAAVLYSISSPLSKILLNNVTPAMMAGLLYLGAGVGMSFIWFIRYQKGNYRSDMQMSKKEIPYVIAMIFLDILAPVLLMTGLKITSAANVALLSNFEIVATSIIALIIFKESVGKRLWIAIILITLSSIILSVKDQGSLDFSYGSIIVLLAAVCWGFENNCTRMLSFKDPLKVVIIKGLGAGIGSLLIAFFTGQVSGSPLCIFAAMILGFASYGLGVYLYVNAQRVLGAAKTSTYYAVSPFIGAAMSFIIFMEVPGMYFVTALIIMLVGTYFASTDEVKE